VDRRLHLYLDGRGLALRVGRDRPVLAPGGRLVDERRHDSPIGCGRPDDGRLAARQAGRLDASLRSWQPIRQRAVPRLLPDSGIVYSMSRSGNVWDNAAMESFFSSLKTERTGRKTYRTRNEARADVFDYIERFYNAVRRHSTIGYLRPVEFERKLGCPSNRQQLSPGLSRIATTLIVVDKLRAASRILGSGAHAPAC
jgi:hypothetical protein